MIALTKKQNDVLTFIKSYHSTNGITPTRQEIADHFGYKSPNAAQEHLNGLEKKGAISLVKAVSRGIILLDPKEHTQKTNKTPFVGHVAAGRPILDEPKVNEFVGISPNFFTPSASYFLEVKGDSMNGIGLFDGDLVAVHKSNAAFNGQVVIARCNNELAIKRFFKKGKEVILKSESDGYEDIKIYLDSEDFSIDGVMVGSVRRCKQGGLQ